MSTLLKKTKQFVSNIFENELPDTCLYHNYEHTQRVVKSTKEIIENNEINDEHKEALELAAWLHDIGYTVNCMDHESHSVILSEEFLKSQNASASMIQNVSKLILATKMEHAPTDLFEEIIRDADASHFAKDYFQETSELLREELKLNQSKKINTSKWLSTNIDLFQNKHSYYTSYARKHWEPKKQENLKKMLAEQKLLETKRKTKKRNREESPEKGIQTLFRVTLRNHLKLSDIADTKANILLSVNAIIISLALSNLIPKLDNPSNQYLIYPTLVFITFCIASIILSVLATRPNITSGEFTRKEIKEKKVNLLFFGNFHKMPLEDYKNAMTDLMEDKDYIYDTMIKDLYFLGKVLHKKYKILRITYTVFMIGIITSVVSFILAFKTLQ